MDHSASPIPRPETDLQSVHPNLAGGVAMAGSTQDSLYADFVDVEMCDTPTQPGPKTYLFCLFDMALGEGRMVASKFSRQDSMQRHARLIHFRGVPENAHRGCPDPVCAGQVFDHQNHFKNHAATSHAVFL